MKSTTKYTAHAPGHAPVVTRRKGQGAFLIAEQHFGRRPKLNDQLTEDNRTVDYIFEVGAERFTVREVLA